MMSLVCVKSLYDSVLSAGEVFSTPSGDKKKKRTLVTVTKCLG